MPTYFNHGNKAVLFNKQWFPAGERMEVSFFVPLSEYPDMELVADEPPVNSKVLFAGELTDEAIDVPYAETVSISVKGSGTVYFADDTEGVTVNGVYNLVSKWALVGKLRVEGTLDVVVERA
ncbi:MAG: hypothetical protein LBK69_06005 [Syntrophomonadaceae bacterium]|jgi:hypothetical protein|nr:hypothetical protein [Syntrophomonadaceae bacterium]